MKKSIAFFAVVLAVLLFAVSCEERLSDVVADRPASITISVSAPAPNIVSTRASDLQETNVTDLNLFFYRKGNYLDHPKKVISLGSAQLQKCQHISSTNYVYTINIEDDELTSGEYYLYAIANASSNNFGTVDISDLSKLGYEELRRHIVKKENELTQMLENSLLMTGVYGRGDGSVTINPGVNVLSDRIHLRRITAKVMFTIETAEGITFRPSTCSIYRYPTSCTLFERSGWTDKDGNIQNVRGTFTAKAWDFEPEYAVNMDILDKDISGLDSFSFYILENAPAADPTKGVPTDMRTREIHEDDSDGGYLTFANAPEDASYVVINGLYNGPAAEAGKNISGNVSYTIHLGDFSASTGSFSNFTVRRNTKYDYKIKITGVNSIIAEATAGDDIPYQDIDSGASGNLITVSENTTNIILDSHFETVMVKMPKFDANQYTLKSLTPFEATVYNSATDAVGMKPSDVSWIKFARPVSATALCAYPGSTSDKLTDVYGLLSDVNSKTERFYLEDGGYYYTVAFVNEYYYEGKKFSEFINAADRELTLASGMSISRDGLSSYSVTPIFSLKQQSIKSMYELGLEDTMEGFNPFGIELLEEFGPVTWDGTAYSDDEYISNSESNGQVNFSSYFNSNENWSTYISSAKFGHFDNNVLLAEGAMKSGKDVAKYQCISRNRDENGDGVINSEELKWYLPAIEQCLTVWYGYPSLGGDAKLHIDYQGYFSSTRIEQKRVWYIDEGASFGKYKGANDWLHGYQNTGKLGVRCARTLKTYNGDPTPTASFDSNNRIVSISTLGKKSVRESGSVTGEYLSHQRDEEPDQLPVAFEIARDWADSAGVTSFSYGAGVYGSVCSSYYTQDGETAGAGGWRIPNEREFGLIARFDASLVNGAMARSIYYRRFDSTPIYSAYYYVGNVNTDKKEVGKTHKIRCVRDYVPANSVYLDM